MTDEPTSREVYVYRIYGGETLLYVGQTRDLKKRLRSHQSKAWWPDEDSWVTVEGPYTRQVALREESIAIRYEAPLMHRNERAAILRAEGAIRKIPPIL
jgi:predicted GIY-YIG superfamily endonuclease